MIKRESFIKIVDALDEYWSDKIEHLKALYIYESYFNDFTDVIINAIEADMDPKHTARDDELTADCGAYISEWLFGTGEFQEKCPDAGALYDYIVAKYQPQENA